MIKMCSCVFCWQDLVSWILKILFFVFCHGPICHLCTLASLMMLLAAVWGLRLIQSNLCYTTVVKTWNLTSNSLWSCSFLFKGKTTYMLHTSIHTVEARTTVFTFVALCRECYISCGVLSDWIFVLQELRQSPVQQEVHKLGLEGQYPPHFFSKFWLFATFFFSKFWLFWILWLTIIAIISGYKIDKR